MPLWPTTDVTINDDDVEDALYRTVRVLNPVLDVVGAPDPLRLKRRVPSSSPKSGPDGGPIDLVADGIARALNAADLPGTVEHGDLAVQEQDDGRLLPTAIFARWSNPG